MENIIHNIAYLWDPSKYLVPFYLDPGLFVCAGCVEGQLAWLTGSGGGVTTSYIEER